MILMNTQHSFGFMYYNENLHIYQLVVIFGIIKQIQLLSCHFLSNYGYNKESLSCCDLKTIDQ